MCLCHFKKVCPGTVGVFDRLFPRDLITDYEEVAAEKDCTCRPGYSYAHGKHIHKAYCRTNVSNRKESK